MVLGLGLDCIPFISGDIYTTPGVVVCCVKNDLLYVREKVFRAEDFSLAK